MRIVPDAPLHRYFLGFYYTLISGLVGGEIGANSSIELVIASMIFIFGQIFNATTLATFSLLLVELDRQERETLTKLTFANGAMENITLPRSFRRSIRIFLISTEKTHHNQSELIHFLSSIPPSLKSRVLAFIFSRFLQKNEVIKKTIKVEEIRRYRSDIRKRGGVFLTHDATSMGLDNRLNFKEELARNIETFTAYIVPVFAKPEQLVVDYGSEERAMYFLTSGECRVLTRRMRERT